MHPLQKFGICLMTVILALLSLYEVTAKSPRLFGMALPGWQETRQVEKSTPWNPPTGLLVVDKFLHEGEEALRYFGIFPG